MTELIGAIQVGLLSFWSACQSLHVTQFIKFFAWIEQWKNRAAEARKKEMQTMVRCRLLLAEQELYQLIMLPALINNLCFALLWNLAPILVTLISFFW